MEGGDTKFTSVNKSRVSPLVNDSMLHGWDYKGIIAMITQMGVVHAKRISIKGPNP